METASFDELELPLNNGCLSAVVGFGTLLSCTLARIWDGAKMDNDTFVAETRRRLLAEVYRVLEPDGEQTEGFYT